MTRLTHRFFYILFTWLPAVFGNVEGLGATLPGSGYADWQAFLMEVALTGTLVNRDAGRIGLRAQPPS
jgi:hypothetical protein